LAVLAVLGLSAVALAQTNTYDFTAKVPAGGSKAKPKPTGFSFNFAVADPAGNIPAPTRSYAFLLAGARVNTSVVKTLCTAAKINAAGDDTGCSKKAIVGTGSVTALVGQAGQPVAAKAGACILKLTAYAAGPNRVALFLRGGGSEAGASPCLAPISQAIDARWKNTSKGAGLSFDVPDPLRHQVGLDVPTLSVKSTWKKLTGKKSGKTAGYFETYGCGTKKQRSVTATFTAEDGTKTPVTKDIGKC